MRSKVTLADEVRGRYIPCENHAAVDQYRTSPLARTTVHRDLHCYPNIKLCEHRCETSEFFTGSASVFSDKIVAQDADVAKVELGSTTARGGFQNEDEILDKFNTWRTDADARAWLKAMNYKTANIKSVTAAKLYGEKADVEVAINTELGEQVEKISIKLVNSPKGFNQIDKRWLATYAMMWKMPAKVVDALKLYVGETPPQKNSRDGKRMYLDELEEKMQQAVVEFFTTHKDEIVSDLIFGDGDRAADWNYSTTSSGQFTAIHGFGGTVPGNNPGTIISNTIRLDFAGHLKVTDFFFDASSLNTAATT